MPDLPVKFPYLETNFETEYSDILERLYQEIKGSPICWLAYERLEDTFAGNNITDDVSFHISNGMIHFAERGCSEPIAVIHFDKQLLAFEKEVSWPQERQSQESYGVKYNRKPIKYSFEYFKRALTKLH